MHVIDVAEHHDRRKLKHPLIEQMWRRIRPLMPKARRFIFDREASAFVGAFIRDFGPAIIENYPFAIPPFEDCYIEYNLDGLLDAVGQRQGADPTMGALDERMAHLIHNNQVVSFIQDATGVAQLHPVTMLLHTDDYVRGQFDPNDLGEDARKKLIYALGSTGNCLPYMVQGLRTQEAVRRWLYNMDFGAVDAFKSMLQEDKLREHGHGTARDLVALLLMLNRQRERVTLTQVAPKRVFYKGKQKVYAAHSMVTLTTEDYGAITRSLMPTGHHESPRRHEVRGFFRHYHKVRGCEHHFLEDNRPHHWTCQHCGTRRVWVHDHLRGDASKGFVTKEYVVTDPAADVND